MKIGFDWRARRFRLALVLGIAVVAAFVAWRTGQRQEQPPCEPGRQVERDAEGRVTQIVRKTCREE